MNIGKLCEYQRCYCNDFLPFFCRYCKKNYCLEHSSPIYHECKNTKDLDLISIECPTCNITIKLYHNEDKKDILEIHNKNCTKISNKLYKKCGKISCTNKMTYSNTFRCKYCDKDVCLQHRFQEEHECSSKL